MDANKVKEMLSNNDIISLLSSLGAEPEQQGNNIFCKTICHHGSKKKLVYFTESQSFRCFTDSCGSMDIYGLVSKVMELDFFSSFKYICMKFGISYQGSFTSDNKIDTSFIKKFKREKTSVVLPNLDKKILTSYYNLYHDSWLEDGISIKSMKRFNIMYSIMHNQIIIPHFDIDGKMIGVRARNLNKDFVEQGRKYMPVYYQNKVLKHPTGAALYGLNLTKDKIENFKTIILFESEKSVLQLDTMTPEMSIGACLSGSSITNYQLEILKKLNINEVVIALDKEFKKIGSMEEKFYAEKIKTIFANKLSPYFKVSVLWDLENILDEKDSPTDKGLNTFKKLFSSRIFI